MTEPEQLLAGLLVVSLWLTLKVLRDGRREIDQLTGAIAYTQEETSRYETEKQETEAASDETRELLKSTKEDVTSLEQRTASMRKVVDRWREAIEKEKQSTQSRITL
jgi:chromosome segregation ATPase